MFTHLFFFLNSDLLNICFNRSGNGICLFELKQKWVGFYAPVNADQISFFWLSIKVVNIFMTLAL